MIKTVISYFSLIVSLAVTISLASLFSINMIKRGEGLTSVEDVYGPSIKNGITYEAERYSQY